MSWIFWFYNNIFLRRGIMEKIIIKHRKTLKLINVLVKHCHGSGYDVEHELVKLRNYIKISKLETQGPLIIKNLGADIDESKRIVLDYDILIQLKIKTRVKYPHEFVNEIKVNDCIYCRFNGKQEELQYAYSKLNLYIWENDLISNGEAYIIYLCDNHKNIDIFKPILK